MPRLVDQPRAINANLNYLAGRHWNLNLAWRYHDGWPTTPYSYGEIDGEEGEQIPVILLGPINSQRLPDYHRLDLRASREWSVGNGRLIFFVDVQNVSNRKNVAGFDLSVDEDEKIVEREAENWPGIFPSVGIRYEF